MLITTTTTNYITIALLPLLLLLDYSVINAKPRHIHVVWDPR